jgi:hypothetical protein
MIHKKVQRYYTTLARNTPRQPVNLFCKHTLARVAMNQLEHDVSAQRASMGWEAALNLNFISLQ